MQELGPDKKGSQQPSMDDERRELVKTAYFDLFSGRQRSTASDIVYKIVQGAYQNRRRRTGDLTQSKIYEIIKGLIETGEFEYSDINRSSGDSRADKILCCKGGSIEADKAKQDDAKTLNQQSTAIASSTSPATDSKSLRDTAKAANITTTPWKSKVLSVHMVCMDTYTRNYPRERKSTSDNVLGHFGRDFPVENLSYLDFTTSSRIYRICTKLLVQKWFIFCSKYIPHLLEGEADPYCIELSLYWGKAGRIDVPDTSFKTGKIPMEILMPRCHTARNCWVHSSGGPGQKRVPATTTTEIVYHVLLGIDRLDGQDDDDGKPYIEEIYYELRGLADDLEADTRKEKDKARRDLDPLRIRLDALDQEIEELEKRQSNKRSYHGSDREHHRSTGDFLTNLASVRAEFDRLRPREKSLKRIIEDPSPHKPIPTERLERLRSLLTSAEIFGYERRQKLMDEGISGSKTLGSTASAMCTPKRSPASNTVIASSSKQDYLGAKKSATTRSRNEHGRTSASTFKNNRPYPTAGGIVKSRKRSLSP